MPLGSESEPQCFGKHWDENAVECAGGRDPTYTDAQTGMHIRDRCGFFHSCGVRVQAQKQEQRLLPAAQLIRPQFQNTPFQNQPTPQPINQQIQLPVNQPGAISQFALQQQINQLTQANQLLQQQLTQTRQIQSHGQSYLGQAVQSIQPLPMMAMEMSVPRYLTVPEPRREHSSIWALLGKEVARSLMKSAGHTMANFWDRTPFDE